MKAAAVIPVFNRIKELDELIGTLDEQDDSIDVLVIVDHGSDPVALKTPKKLDVRYIRRDPTLWFTAAVNEGLRFIRKNLRDVDVVFLMNDDITFTADDTISKLKELVRGDASALWACPALTKKGTVLYETISVDLLKARYLLRKRGKSAAGLAKRNLSSATLPTRILALSSFALGEIGLLDERNLPQYGSDYEWTTRAKKKGFGLNVLTSHPIITEPNPKTQSRGRSDYSAPYLVSFIRKTFNPHRAGNLVGEFHLARRSFALLPALFWIVVNSGRLVLGWVVFVFLKALA